MRSSRRRSRPLLLLALLAAASCRTAPPPAPPPAPPEPAVAFDDDAVTAMAALLRMEDRRRLEPGLLTTVLDDPVPEVRRRAVLAAGRIGDEAAAPLILSALQDPEPGVRAGAAFALGILGDSAAPIIQELSRLALDTLAGTDVRVEAIAALGRLGSPAGHPALRAVLAAGSAPEAVLTGALLALWRLPPDGGAPELLVPYLGSQDDELRWRAAYAVMRLADPRSAGALLHLLEDPHPLVRALAARGLSASFADSAGIREAAGDALERMLDDPDPHVRINAARAIAGYAEPRRAAAVAERLWDPDTNTAIAAADALASLAATGYDAAHAAAHYLEALLGADRLPAALRRAALVALVRADPQAGLGRARVAASDPAWLERLYAARALAGAPWPDAAPLAQQLAVDADPRVAAATLDALAELAGDSIDAAHALALESLNSPYPVVRAAALRMLGRRADPADLPVFLDAYARARGDAEVDAAHAAIDALGTLAARGVPVDRPFYTRFPPPGDRRTHVRAVDRLGPGSWGDPPPPGDGRDHAYYEQVTRAFVVPELEGAAPRRVLIRTAGGEIVLELLGADAPLTVHNFVSLIAAGYYRDVRWHRVVPNFVLQDGDPRGDGLGGPGYAIRDEINRVRYLPGTVGMALAGPDTGGSQFFITHSPQPHLDGGFTVFGRVVAGMETARRVVQDDPITAIELLP